MLDQIKSLAQLNNYYFFYFSWGFYFFSAGYFALKKLNNSYKRQKGLTNIQLIPV